MFFFSENNKRKIAITLMLFFVFALAGNTTVIAQEQAVISVETVRGAAGQTVTVPVKITDSGGMAGGEVTVSYDPEILEIKEITAGEVIKGTIFIPNPKLSKNSLKFLWAKAEMVPITADGEIALMTFLLKKTGESELTIKDLELLDINLNEIPVKGQNGKVVVTEGSSSGTADDSDNGSSGSSPVTTEPGDSGEEGTGDDEQENEEEGIIREGPAILSVSDAAGAVGETITVIINIENPRGMAGGNLVLSYNPELVEPEKISSGGIMSGIIPMSNLEHSDNTLSIAWIGLTGKTADGTIAEISFILKEEGLSELDLNEFTLVDADGEEIPVEAVNGSIRIGEDEASGSDTAGDLKSYYLYILVILIVAAVLTVFFLLKRGRDKRNNKDEFFEE